jgi:hypothetical protein
MCGFSYTELSISEPTARKDYCCEWCNEKIPKGLKHFSRSYIADGDFGYGRLHFECVEAMGKADHDDVCEGWTPGDFKRGSPLPKFSEE